MNRERFERLIKYFEEEFPAEWISKKKFNLCQWMGISKTDGDFDSAFDKVILENNQIVIEPKFCQTHGCIMGWATTIPEFKKEGLHLTTTGYYSNIVTLGYKEYEDFVAAAKFFDISEQDAEYLFSPENYGHDEELHDPKFAVARIKEVMANGFPEQVIEETW